MTGYGAAEVALEDGRVLRVEVKTVNHRHLSPSVRVPRGWEGLEKKVVERIRETILRGRVSLSVSCGNAERDDFAAPELDLARARKYAQGLEEAAAELGLEGRLNVNTLARLPGVFRTEKSAAPLPDEAALLGCVGDALRGVLEMREAEGRRLEEELRRSMERIKGELHGVEVRAPERLVRERNRLRERIQVLSESVETDEDRLAREIAYLAEKWDLAEEIVRLRSHLAFFSESLNPEAGAKVGKRLSFVVQEMNREANTIGSKANDAGIAASAVAVKEELERIREQLENVE